MNNDRDLFLDTHQLRLPGSPAALLIDRAVADPPTSPLVSMPRVVPVLEHQPRTVTAGAETLNPLCRQPLDDADHIAEKTFRLLAAKITHLSATYVHI